MKTRLLFFLLFSFAGTSFGQDVIKARNGAQFTAKVVEITPSYISYRASFNPQAPVLRASREEIIWIRFRNGNYEYLNPDPLPHRTRLIPPETAAQATN